MDGLAVEIDGPAPRFHQPGQPLQQGRFARAVRPDQGRDLSAGGSSQRQLADRPRCHRRPAKGFRRRRSGHSFSPWSLPASRENRHRRGFPPERPPESPPAPTDGGPGCRPPTTRSRRRVPPRETARRGRSDQPPGQMRATPAPRNPMWPPMATHAAVSTVAMPSSKQPLAIDGNSQARGQLVAQRQDVQHPRPAGGQRNKQQATGQQKQDRASNRRRPACPTST